MVISVSSTTQLPDLFRMYSGKIEDIAKLFPNAKVFHFVRGNYQIIAVEAKT